MPRKRVQKNKTSRIAHITIHSQATTYEFLSSVILVNHRVMILIMPQF
jgi:hypothetical protein